MQTIRSDTQIRADLRMVLTRHRVDLNRTAFSCARGVVRLQGELNRRANSAEAPIDLGEIELLEHELECVKGVARVHFDLANWRRLSTGEWQPIHKRERVHVQAAPVGGEPVPATVG